MTLPDHAATVRHLQDIADDKAETPERREAARVAVGQIGQAHRTALAWGGDEHARLRMDVYKAALAKLPEPTGGEKLELGVELEALCEVVGVPLDGPAREAVPSPRGRGSSTTVR